VRLTLSRTTDDIYIAARADGRVVGTYFDLGAGWWTVCRANGTEVRVWMPGGDPESVAQRAFGGGPADHP
jgi:hypothetical protein